MKNKKAISIITAVVMLFSVFAFDGGIGLAKTTDAPTPTGVHNAHLKWERQFGEGYSNAVTPPLLLGGYIYTASKGTLYKLDKNTGEIADRCKFADITADFTTLAPEHDGTAEDGSDATRIFVHINRQGTIAAIDITGETMKVDSGWDNGAGEGISEQIGEQTITPMVYHDGHLYTAGYGEAGRYVEMDAATGKVETVLAENGNGGHYWAGAYVSDKGFAVFGEESNDTSQPKDTTKGTSLIRSVAVTGNAAGEEAGTVLDTIEVEGSVRGSVVPDEEDGVTYLYFVSQARKLYKVVINEDGTFGETRSVALSGRSVGVPQITDARVYVGTDAPTVDVIDKTAMTKKYSVSVPGYPQGEFLIRQKDAQTDYVYCTYNKKPGGLYFIEAGETKAESAGGLYEPDHEQWCISPVICDDEGTLFFKNDSGYIMAVVSGYDTTAPALKKTSVTAAATKVSWNAVKNVSSYEVYRAASASGAYKRITVTTATSWTDKTTLPKKTYYYKVRGRIGTGYTNYSNVITSKSTLAKPKVSTKAGKRKIRISWKKVTGASGYKIYQASKKGGKYKCVKTVKSGTTVKFVKKGLKKNKKYYYKVKAYKKVGGTTAYSGYSNISYKRAR